MEKQSESTSLALAKFPEIAVSMEAAYQEQWEAILQRACRVGKGYGRLSEVEALKRSMVEYPRHRSLPHAEYFQEVIRPTVESMAESPEEFQQISGDALTCLEYLVFWSGRTSAYGGLVEEFFDDYEGEEPSYSFRSKSGQFKYFYKKYGRWMALAVAKFQGAECDLHYDGADYSWGTHRIEEYLSKVLEALPEEYREDALEAFVNYGGSFQAKAFWRALPRVIEHLSGNEKNHLLDYYFKIAKSAPKIDPQHGDSEGFPVVEPEDVEAELDGLESLPDELRDSACDLATSAFHQERPFKCLPTFTEESKDIRYSIIGRALVIPEVIQKFLDLGYTNDQISEIFKISERVPQGGFLIIEGYVDIEQNFPGGVEGLITYLEDFNDSPQFISSIIRCSEKFPFKGEKYSDYLEKAKEVAGLLGDSGHNYFSERVLENYFDEFMQQIDGILELAESFIEFSTSKYYDVVDLVFSTCVLHCNDENYDALIKGLEFIRDSYPERLKDQEVEHHTGQSYLHLAVTKFDTALFLFPKEDRRQYFPDSPEVIEDQAKIVTHFIFDQEYGPRSGQGFDYYLNLIQRGLDYRVAALLEFEFKEYHRFSGDVQVTEKVLGYREIEGIEAPVSFEKACTVFGRISEIRESIKAVFGEDYHRLDSKLIGIQPPLPTPSSNQNLVKPDFSEMSLARIDDQLIKLDELEKDPDFGKIMDFKNFREELKKARELAYFRSIVDIGIISDRFDIDSSFLRQTNPTTQAVISGTALMGAIGAMKIKGMEGCLQPISSGISPRELLVPANAKRYKDELMSRIAQLVPHVERMVLEDRDKLVGLLPEGLKVHTTKGMDGRLLKSLEAIFGLYNTCFHLQHAGQTLIQEPTVSDLELALMTEVNAMFGVIDKDSPDMQPCIVGRWSEETAAIVGASMLLATERGVEYDVGAFTTTHRETGKRIMAYDAGIRRTGLPYDLPKAEGRTDMLGRHSYSDLHKYRILGTLAAHHDFGGYFGNLFRIYSRLFKDILREHGLLGHLMDSAWVYDHAEKGDSFKDHHNMVSMFTGAWTKASGMVHLGVIREVNLLIKEIEKEILGHREKIILADPGEYQRLMSH
ncbi:hypothetical protein ACFL21_01640 [Patescibacteria group bacterium]